jgi:hypothetical protein
MAAPAITTSAANGFHGSGRRRLVGGDSVVRWGLSSIIAGFDTAFIDQGPW